jgi:hypothetical protein
MSRVRQCPKISRDEESTQHIRQVERGDDYALSKRNVLASWVVYLAERETWQSTVHGEPVVVITSDHQVRLDTSCLRSSWRYLHRRSCSLVVPV